MAFGAAPKHEGIWFNYSRIEFVAWGAVDDAPQPTDGAGNGYDGTCNKHNKLAIKATNGDDMYGISTKYLHENAETPPDHWLHIILRNYVHTTMLSLWPAS